MKLLIGGPVHSGKTCLREALRYLISRRSRSRIYPCYLPANPDGDGRWFVATAQSNLVRARYLRKSACGAFDAAFAQRVIGAIQAINAPIVLIDMGGKPGPYDPAIIDQGSHAVILYKNSLELKLWRDLFRNKTIIAELESIHEAGKDEILSTDGNTLRGTVHNLDYDGKYRDSFVLQTLSDNILNTLRGIDPNCFRQPPTDSLSLSTAPLGDKQIAGAVINVRLNPESQSNKSLVNMVWELPLITEYLTAADLVQINGPLTMAVAVALVQRVRSIAPKAEIAIFDPDTPANVSLKLTGEEPRVIGEPLDITVHRNGQSYQISCHTRNKATAKETLIQAAGNKLLQYRDKGTAKTLEITGHMPVMVAAAISLFLSDDNTKIKVFDPPSGELIEVTRRT